MGQSREVKDREGISSFKFPFRQSLPQAAFVHASVVTDLVET